MLFLVKFFLYVLIQIQKQRNYFKHAELSVFSVLDLALYSEQLHNWHSSVIVKVKYNISMNQFFHSICQRRKHITNNSILSNIYCMRLNRPIV